MVEEVKTSSTTFPFRLSRWLGVLQELLFLPPFTLMMHAMSKSYFGTVHLIERLHRHFLDVLRTETRRMGITDINAVQALLLYNIGEDEVAVRDLKDRGYYQGSNVSYNIKALTECGYLMQERSQHDRRSVRLKLTDKGMTLCNAVRKLQNDLATALGNEAETIRAMETTFTTLSRLERTWTDFIHFGVARPSKESVD